ncbi:MAG: FliM/FliN family flagellar motor C-terminal domain-containing protein, partial [Enterobacterales bacterium]|nr:FliM/FliN family flagellar motor C-terminal domain-containing protein [Enterobacterales bacterium]
FSILLDNHHVDKMLSNMRGPIEETQPRENITPAQIERMFYSLPLKLNGRLASLNLTVSQLLNIEAGDVIPISLNEQLPIFIGKEQMFSAVVAEDRGKLFLSEFNDKTTEMNYE